MRPAIRAVATCCLAVAGLFSAFQVSAVRLDFVPASTQKFVGDVFSVDVVVSGLDAAGEIVSTFDLDVTYDSAILNALGVTFGTALGGGGANSFQFGPIFGSGVIDFAESSLLTDAALDALQGDSVTLASLSFRAAAVGVSPLQFVPDPLFVLTGRFNAAGIPADLNPDVGDGRVEVIAAAVPAPGVLGLIVLGLAVLGGFRHRPFPT